MDLAELEEAHSDVTKLTNTDLAGAVTMSNAYDDTDMLSEESGPSMKSAPGGSLESRNMKKKAKLEAKMKAIGYIDESKVCIP